MLSHSRALGAARVLLAALAALADETRTVSGRSTDELRSVAGLAESTYRRGRAALLRSGEIVLEVTGGGRSITNRRAIGDPAFINRQPLVAARTRPLPPAGARPLIATARQLTAGAQEQSNVSPQPGFSASAEGADSSGASLGNPGQNRTVSDVKGPGLSGVSDRNRGQNRTVSDVKGPGLSGVSGRNPGQNRTVSDVKGPGLSGVSALNPRQVRTVSPAYTPPQTPPETPPPYVRAGREPQNPRTCKDPPSPPEGGSLASSISIVEDYLTDRGRRRQRTVTVSQDEARSQLGPPTPIDHSDWQHIRTELQRAAGESAFEIWLSGLELVACDHDEALLLECPADTRSWVNGRFGPLLDRSAAPAGRQVRLVSERELRLLHALAAGTDARSSNTLSFDKQEAI